MSRVWVLGKLKCVNCRGTGHLEECFYCGGGFKPKSRTCAYCMWEGDILPKGKTEQQCNDENICCMCTGSGIQREIDPADNHALIMHKMDSKCQKCGSRYLLGYYGEYSDTEASFDASCDDCEFRGSYSYGAEWRKR